MLENLTDHIVLSRMQFALTAMFHILWPVLTIGLSLFLVTVEALWLKTGNPDYYHHARFWGKLFLLNFAVGVVTGIPLEFEFGTNWAGFATASGDFFGAILGFEGAMAFMLEAGFLGIMMFGWQRVAPPIHLFSTCMVAFGASLSAFWILAANSWMQTPAGGHMEDGRFVVDSFAEAVFNPDMPWGVSHMWVAALETSAFVIGGISAWYILKDRHAEFFLKSFRIIVTAALIITPLQIFLGDGSGRAVFEYQPAKGAAIEGHWDTNPPGQGADWAIAAWPNRSEQKNDWEITVPNGLSLLATRTLDGQVQGLKEFPVADQPPLMPVLFYGFRIMAGIGVMFFVLTYWTGFVWWRHGLTVETLAARRWLLRIWVMMIPMGYIAVEMGWVVREVGRQPWLIYGILRTSEGASKLPAGVVGGSLIGYIVLYTILLLVFLTFARRLIKKGPNFSAAVPARHTDAPVNTRPFKHVVDGRAQGEK
ncbi:MAG: cytochrome ubiquinol oxidase subunit I [Candidatus Competibacteraceae bacterium]|jgi:cytochrome d ubiquinol oxidase subunit I|nr:cytochrome ubiquinol oxidase subunit I [Candidatus Competibacteraceae bacterium]